MMEYESTSDFNIILRDIANNSFSLREKMSEEKPVKKILRSLPQKFDMNVTSIEEAQGLIPLKVDEIIGSLQTFEVSINGGSENKSKCGLCIQHSRE